MYLGSWKIDDYLTFSCNTHDPSDGSASDADSAPSYRIYEDETASPIVNGNLALLDGDNTTGFYSEQVQLTAANGFEKGKSYTIYIEATVSSTKGTMSHSFQMEAEVDANTVSASNVSSNLEQIGGVTQSATDLKDFADTGYNPSTHKVENVALTDTCTTNSDMRGTDGANTTVPDVAGTAAGLHATTDGLITTVDGVVDNILTDTGTTLEGHLTDIKGTGFSKDTHSLPQCLTATSVTVSDKTGFKLASDGADSISASGGDIKAIKDKTDNLPDDPADDSDIDGQLSTITDHLTDIKGTGFSKDTHSLPQCITATGFSTHTANNVRDAILDDATRFSGANLDAAISSRAPEAGGNIADIKAKTDNLPSGIAKNVALSNFEFVMIDSADHITPKTALSVTAKISKDGGAFASCTNAVSEVGDGVYKINLTQTEMNADVITLKFTATDADQRNVTMFTS